MRMSPRLLGWRAAQGAGGRVGGWVDDALVIMDDQAEGIMLDEERVVHGFEDKCLGECMYRVFVHLRENKKLASNTSPFPH